MPLSYTDSLINTDSSSRKIYSIFSIMLGTVFGGPFVAGFLIAKNFRVFGNYQASRNSILLGIISSIVLFGGILMIPEDIMAKIPNNFFVDLYSPAILFIAIKLQGRKINEFLVNNGSKYSGWRAFGYGMLGFLIIMIFVALFYFTTIFKIDRNIVKVNEKITLHFTADAGKEKAEQLANAIVQSGFLDNNDEADLYFSKEYKNYRLKFILNDSTVVLDTTVMSTYISFRNFLNNYLTFYNPIEVSFTDEYLNREYEFFERSNEITKTYTPLLCFENYKINSMHTICYNKSMPIKDVKKVADAITRLKGYFPLSEKIYIFFLNNGNEYDIKFFANIDQLRYNRKNIERIKTTVDYIKEFGIRKKVNLVLIDNETFKESLIEDVEKKLTEPRIYKPLLYLKQFVVSDLHKVFYNVTMPVEDVEKVVSVMNQKPAFFPKKQVIDIVFVNDGINYLFKAFVPMKMWNDKGTIDSTEMVLKFIKEKGIDKKINVVFIDNLTFDEKEIEFNKSNKTVQTIYKPLLYLKKFSFNNNMHNIYYNATMPIEDVEKVTAIVKSFYDFFPVTFNIDIVFINNGNNYTIKFFEPKKFWDDKNLNSTFINIVNYIKRFGVKKDIKIVFIDNQSFEEKQLQIVTTNKYNKPIDFTKPDTTQKTVKSGIEVSDHLSYLKQYKINNLHTVYYNDSMPLSDAKKIKYAIKRLKDLFPRNKRREIVFINNGNDYTLKFFVVKQLWKNAEVNSKLKSAALFIKYMGVKQKIKLVLVDYPSYAEKEIYIINGN